MADTNNEDADDRGTKRQKMDPPPPRKVQPELKLHYFDIKGKGESIRLICAYGGLELEDHRFESRDQFLAMKASSRLSFGQVPMLEVDGKVAMVQSAAIMRYLGKLTGLYPMDDHILAQKIDAIMDQVSDVFMGSTVLTYGLRYAIDLSPEAKEKCYGIFNETVLPTHLKRAERVLQSSSTGWMAGTTEPSPADFVWYCSLVNMAAKKEMSDENKSLSAFPKLKAFMEKFESLEAIKEYYRKEAEAHTDSDKLRV